MALPMCSKCECEFKKFQDFLYTFSMALYHEWDVKNGFAYVLQFFSLISDVLGGVFYSDKVGTRHGHR